MGSKTPATVKPTERVDKLVIRADNTEQRMEALEAIVATLRASCAEQASTIQGYAETFQSNAAQIEAMQITIETLERALSLQRHINTAFKVSSPEDAATVARTLDTLGNAHNSNVGLCEVVATLAERADRQQADLKKAIQDGEGAKEQLVSIQAALQQTTSAQRAQEQRVQQLARQAGTTPGDMERMLVVRAPLGTTCAQVSTVMAQCLASEQSVIVKVTLATNQSPPNRDPRVQQAATPPTASATTASSTPPRKLLFVVTLATRQLVDKALKNRRCRELLKGSHDFKLDDYLTREQLQQRMLMRPTQQRLQQLGVVAAWRGVELWQLVAPLGAAPDADRTWRKVEAPADVGAGDAAAVAAGGVAASSARVQPARQQCPAGAARGGRRGWEQAAGSSGMVTS
jgi:hypothetical protein